MVSCAGVVVAVIGVTIWLMNGGQATANQMAAVNRAQAQAMLPTIEVYLDNHASELGFGGGLDARLKPRVFCEAHIIEIRTDGPRRRVGMIVRFGEFARSGNTLIEGANGYPGIGEVMVLSGSSGHFRVVSLRVGPPYHDQVWVNSNFSRSAAAWLLSANPPTAPDPIRQAWREFGFPAGTPAVEK